MSTPPTSPQRAQTSARQAERDQRDLGSPPFRRQPYRLPPFPPRDAPGALQVSIFSSAMFCMFSFKFYSIILLFQYICIQGCHEIQ